MLIERFGTITLICGDCMEYMQNCPDKSFDLAIVDPPYGIGEDGAKNHSRGKCAEATKYTPKQWDKASPDEVYFKELMRVSKNQIICGANHFISRIPFDSPCWIVWDKENGKSHFADCELAYTSFKTAVRKFVFRWQGMLQGNMKHKQMRIHPTEKPIQLYEWLLTNYAESGQKIIDTHGGSMSHAIAAHKLGFDLTIIEKDPEYYAQAKARLLEYQKQLTLF